MLRYTIISVEVLLHCGLWHHASRMSCCILSQKLCVFVNRSGRPSNQHWCGTEYYQVPARDYKNI